MINTYENVGRHFSKCVIKTGAVWKFHCHAKRISFTAMLQRKVVVYASVA